MGVSLTFQSCTFPAFALAEEEDLDDLLFATLAFTFTQHSVNVVAAFLGFRLRIESPFTFLGRLIGWG